jgi:predicted kinase
MKKNGNLNRVIILKGSPGVGKSFTARKLISRLKTEKIARISIDEVLHFDQRKSLTKDKLKLAKFHTAIMVRSFLREGFDVVIEYTFDIPEHLEFMIDKIKRSHSEEIPASDIRIFHLTASIEEVAKRNKTRKDGTDPLPAGTLKKLYKLCESTAGLVEGEIIIDTDKAPVKKAVERIMESVI